MTRAAIIELLRAGHGDRTIARQVGTTISTVTRLRAQLGLPKAHGGTKKAGSLEDLFWRRTQPTEDGHLEWAGHRNSKGTATLHWGKDVYSARRIAYRIRTGRDPIGYAHTTCNHPGCMLPAHVDDSAVTPRRAHHRNAVGRTPNGSNQQVEELLRQGLSDKEIGRRLRTDPKRVSRLRAQLGLPAVETPTLTFEDRWAANTEPVDGGHLRWTGRLRDGTTPAVLHDGRDASPRRIAFERLHGRAAVGPVRPGCGYGPCVKPEHLEDQVMRQQLDAQYAAIFGEAA